jgi:hypothetical protein
MSTARIAKTPAANMVSVYDGSVCVGEKLKTEKTKALLIEQLDANGFASDMFEMAERGHMARKGAPKPSAAALDKFIGRYGASSNLAKVQELVAAFAIEWRLPPERLAALEAEAAEMRKMIDAFLQKEAAPA